MIYNLVFGAFESDPGPDPGPPENQAIKTTAGLVFL